MPPGSYKEDPLESCCCYSNPLSPSLLMERYLTKFIDDATNFAAAARPLCLERMMILHRNPEAHSDSFNMLIAHDCHNGAVQMLLNRAALNDEGECVLPIHKTGTGNQTLESHTRALAYKKRLGSQAYIWEAKDDLSQFTHFEQNPSPTEPWDLLAVKEQVFDAYCAYICSHPLYHQIRTSYELQKAITWFEHAPNHACVKFDHARKLLQETFLVAVEENSSKITWPFDIEKLGTKKTGSDE